MDKRLSVALQIVACALAAAFVADEWSDHTLRARAREWWGDQRSIVPEPVAVEVEPAPGELRAVTDRATQITRGEVRP